jgi:hypothetical protein
MEKSETFREIRRLIKEDEERALHSFRQKDFPALLVRKIKNRPRQRRFSFIDIRRPRLALGTLGLVITLAVAVIIVVSSSSTERKGIDKIKNFLLRVPEFQGAVIDNKAAHLQMSKDQIHRLELAWFFRDVFYSLHRRELSKAQLQGLFCRALEFKVSPREEESAAPGEPVEMRELRLEERIQRLIREKRIYFWLEQLSNKSEEV